MFYMSSIVTLRVLLVVSGILVGLSEKYENVRQYLLLEAKNTLTNQDMVV